MSDVGKLIFLIVFIVFMVAVGPFITISAINALFGTGIEFTFVNWLATFWLSLIASGGVRASSN